MGEVYVRYTRVPSPTRPNVTYTFFGLLSELQDLTHYKSDWSLSYLVHITEIEQILPLI